MVSLISCHNLLGKNEKATLVQELIENTKVPIESDDHPAVKSLLDGYTLSNNTSDLCSETRYSDGISGHEAFDHIGIKTIHTSPRLGTMGAVDEPLNIL